MEVFELLDEVRVTMFELFNLVAFMRPVNNTLGADWVAPTSKTVISYDLV